MPVKINGSTSGSVTLAAPDTGSDVTLTLPGSTGTVQTVPGAWTAYTPTVTAQTGTPTTVSATGRYCQIGKVVHLVAQITVTNKGTAADGIIFSLPVTKNASAPKTPLTGAETDVIGGQASGWFGFSTQDNALVKKYDWTTLWVNNYVIVISGTYEAA